MCLKVAMYKNRHVLIVSAKQKDPFVYDLTSDEVVLSLTSNSPGISIRCISVFGNIIFCCDAKKNVFTFDWSLDKTLRQVDICKSSFILFLLACILFFTSFQYRLLRSVRFTVGTDFYFWVVSMG